MLAASVPANETVLVFDLDDTLYAEIDYVRSGLRALEQWLLALYPERPVAAAFAPLHAGGARFALGPLLERLELPPSMETQLLWAYRSHRPTIALRAGVADWLTARGDDFLALAVLTDGRSLTQRAKLAALGLGHLPAYVSEEWGGADKPDPRRFEAIARRWPAARYVYVGDNVGKDFVAPRALGWVSVGLRDDGRNVHPRMDDAALLAGRAPDVWIRRIGELDDVLVS